MTSSAKATFSWTVLLLSSRKSWNTVPTWRRSAGTFQLDSRARSFPATCTWPLVARSSLRTRRRKVDLPEPGLPDQEDELPLADLDADVVQRRPGLARVELGDVLEADHGCITTGASEGDGSPAVARRPCGLPGGYRGSWPDT